MFDFQKTFLLVIALLLFCVGSVQAEEADDSPESIDVVTILLFMFFGLGCGVIVSQFLSIFGEAVPYTVLVFLMGLLFSTAADTPGTFGESISQWLGIDAELLLFVFLPPLIFGEAMSLNWYHLKGGFIQSVILAGPGVLIGAALMGVITKAILPYNWGWNLAMTFGSILSATGKKEFAVFNF
jgi:NhaP-type Na+/H+ or K+/H+ antiporter